MGINRLLLYMKALELAARDSCEYDFGDTIDSNTLNFITENYLKKAEKILDKSG